MDKIRSANEATGGLTNAERDKLLKHHAMWVTRASRTVPADREKVKHLIKQLYSAASLSEPVVEVVSSPGVMAFAGTFASRIFKGILKDKNYMFTLPEPDSVQCKKEYEPIVKEIINTLSVVIKEVRNYNDTVNQSDIYHRILYATYSLGDGPTANAMDRQTNMDIRESLENYQLRDMENAIVDAMKDPFGNSIMTLLMQNNADEWGLSLAKKIFIDEKEAVKAIDNVCDWWMYSQRGAADTYWDFCVTAARDILGLHIPENEKYKIWEECGIESAYRYLHPAFCLVSEFPSKIVNKNLNYINGSGQNNYYWNDGWSV